MLLLLISSAVAARMLGLPRPRPETRRTGLGSPGRIDGTTVTTVRPSRMRALGAGADVTGTAFVFGGTSSVRLRCDVSVTRGTPEGRRWLARAVGKDEGFAAALTLRRAERTVRTEASTSRGSGFVWSETGAVGALDADAIDLLTAIGTFTGLFFGSRSAERDVCDIEERVFLGEAPRPLAAGRFALISVVVATLVGAA